MIFFRLFLCSLLAVQTLALDPSTTFPEYISSLGIPLEDHFVTTDDGYILHVFHFPQPKPAPVILFQHGILASAWCWTINSFYEGNYSMAPAIRMYQLGYDVWLSNSRGNDFSVNHTHLSPLSKEFWDYTFHDMGLNDEPAVIDYVTSTSNVSTLTYVGWSQGTTSLFISGSLPERKNFLESKINLFVALSPVSFMTHQSSLLLGVLAKLGIGGAIEALFPYSFLSGSVALHDIEEVLCKLSLGLICKIGVDTVCGTSSADDSVQIENIAAHFPAGTSVKDINHYAQFISADRFGQYDYGKSENEKRYKQANPPDYQLSNFNLKTALFAGSNDLLVGSADLLNLISKLGSVANGNLVFTKTYDNFSHLTWMVGKTSSSEWLNDFTNLVKTHNPLY